MSRMGLVGPSYASQSPNLDAEACINLYVEVDDGGAGNAPLAMYSTPGTKVFTTLQNAGGGVGGGFIEANPTTRTGNSLAPSGTDTSTHTNLTVVYIEANGVNSNATGAVPTGGPWTHIDDPNGGAHSSMYAQFEANPVTITPSQVLAGVADTWSTMLFFFGSSTGAVITNPQKAQFVSGAFGAGNHNTSFAGNTTIGSGILVVLCTVITTGPNAPTVTDTAGNVYTLISSVTTAGASIFILWSPNVPVGNPVMTFNLNSGSVSGTAIAYEIAGVGPILASNGPVRGELQINGRAFAVSGPNFFEVLANGTNINWGTVANDALPVTMAASPQQLLLASAGTAYVFDLMANTLTAIPGATFDGPVAQAAICDDFFILTIQNSKEFVVSAPLDATDWVTNGTAIVSVFPDNIVSMLVFQRQVWFFSDTQSVVYYDSGNLFPFDVNPNAFIEAGSAAENSPAIFNNSIAWLGADARGNGKVWLASGYTPTRISNHAIEFAIQSYSRIDDAVGLSYQDQGHEFYCLYFPTPSVMWLYDAMTGMWHQRGFWVESIGQFRAAHYQNHMFAFGKHLVGDWQSGNVYQMSIPVSVGTGWDFVTDAGNPIRRVRRAPHVSKEQKKQFHIELQIYVETGLGPIPPLLDGAGKARDPQLMLSWSDDGGHTFGNEFILNCGQAGQFKSRARKLQLGSSRDRVYQIAMSDPIPWRVVDGYLQVVQGTGI